MPDLRLADEPAEVDLASMAQSREVDESPVGVADDDVAAVELLEGQEQG